MPAWKRSRALWDRARHEKRAQHYLAAVLYEIQPIRYSSIKNHGYDFEHIVRAQIPSLVGKAGHATIQLGKFTLPLLVKHWRFVVGILLYYVVVRWIHNTVQAGPAVLIMTALVWIFTTGLSDAPREGLSPYAVFNRGFERLMGEVDADHLLAQHVAGGGMMMMMMNNNNNNNNRDINHDDRQGDEPRRNNDHRRRDEPAAERPDIRPDAAEQQDGNDEQDLPNENEDNQQGPRRRGKKGRRQRRTVEQRRELQRQRQVAREMGFGRDGEQGAMLQLVEDQVGRET